MLKTEEGSSSLSAHLIKPKNMEEYTATEIMGIWNEAHPENPCTENEAARYLKSHIFVKNLVSPKTIVRVMELGFCPSAFEERNFAILTKNQDAIKAILSKKKLTKLDKLRFYLLNGRVLSGWIMTEEFNIYSYRDAIYELRKQGMAIEGKTIHEKGVQHQEWWLACYDYAWAKNRCSRGKK